MLLDDLNHLLQVVIRVLIVKQSVCQVLQGLEETVQVHLIVVRPPHYVFVNDVVVRLHYVPIREARVLGELLELAAGDEVVALLASQDLEHLLCVRIQVQLVQLVVRHRQNLLKTPDFVNFCVVRVLGHYFECVAHESCLHVLVQLR